MKISGVEKKKAKCKECRKQHTDKNSTNGKHLAVIENNTGNHNKSITVNGSDVTNKQLCVSV